MSIYLQISMCGIHNLETIHELKTIFSQYLVNNSTHTLHFICVSRLKQTWKCADKLY